MLGGGSLENVIQEELFSLNNLKTMEVIDIDTGRRLGHIKDLVVDCEEYKIDYILLPQEKNSWFRKENFLQIPWNNIDKIGIDVILVHAELKFNAENFKENNTNNKFF